MLIQSWLMCGIYYFIWWHFHFEFIYAFVYSNILQLSKHFVSLYITWCKCSSVIWSCNMPSLNEGFIMYMYIYLYKPTVACREIRSKIDFCTWYITPYISLSLVINVLEIPLCHKFAMDSVVVTMVLCKCKVLTNCLAVASYYICIATYYYLNYEM